jgi:hypothetical protein
MDTDPEIIAQELEELFNIIEAGLASLAASVAAANKKTQHLKRHAQ